MANDYDELMDNINKLNNSFLIKMSVLTCCQKYAI